MTSPWLSSFGFTTDPVLAALNGPFTDEINFAVEQGLQLLLHLSVGKEAPLGFGGKGDE